MQSLLGMMNFAMRIIPQGQSFISRHLVFLTPVQDPDQILNVSDESPLEVTDAAAFTGFAAIFGLHWFAESWPPEILLIPGFTQSSSLFELYPIFAAAQF